MADKNLSEFVKVAPFLDEDDMVSDSAAHGATQQSIKAYVDGKGWSLIAETTVGAGGAASVTFGSIPATYKALAVIGMSRTEKATGGDNLAIRINADTGNNYDTERFFIYEGGFSALSDRVTTEGRLGIQDGANSRASSFSPVYVDIPYYTDTNIEKSLISRMSNVGSLGSDNTMNISFGQTHWRNSAAIASITLFQQTGEDLAEYTTFALFGID